jgi:uncharacterized protein
MEPDIMSMNDDEALRRRLDAGTLTWRGPALMLFARAAFAVAAQALVAAIFALWSSPTPWHDAEPWLPVYGTLIDAGCLALLWRLTHREGMGLANADHTLRHTCHQVESGPGLDRAKSAP